MKKYVLTAILLGTSMIGYSQNSQEFYNELMKLHGQCQQAQSEAYREDPYRAQFKVAQIQAKCKELENQLRSYYIQKEQREQAEQERNQYNRYRY